jgi:pimeloyl-ACP methyl ester carboxylesterase
MNYSYVNIGEGQIHYRSDGEGPCILFLHQSPLSSEEYSGIIPLVSKEFRAIAIDSMGHGNSSDPVKEFDIEDYARTTVAALDLLGVSKTTLVGHHTGALIAVEIAANYPQRINKLVLSGCPVYTPKEWESFLSQPMTRDIPLTSDGKFLSETWKRYCSMMPNADLRTSFKPFILALRARTRPYDAHFAAGRYLVAPKLGKIKAQTLLVSGDKDMFIHQLESTGKLIPNCTTAVIKGGGPFLNFEVPDEFARAILEFNRK